MRLRLFNNHQMANTCHTTLVQLRYALQIVLAFCLVMTIAALSMPQHRPPNRARAVRPAHALQPLRLPASPHAAAAAAEAARNPANPYPLPKELLGPDLSKQTATEAAAKSQGCIACHSGVGDMHQSGTVQLGCVDCHGGDPCALTQDSAHVPARFPQASRSSANPVRSYALLNHKSRQRSCVSSIRAICTSGAALVAVAATPTKCCKSAKA